jgi:hypothetical protein
MQYFAGISLGQVSQPSAFAVLGKESASGASAYAVRHLARWQAGTPYREIVAEVGRVLRLPELGGCPLVIDCTGVGGGVAALFREVSSSVRSAVISSGHAVTFGEDGVLHLPKKELVAVLQVLLQTRGRFQVAASLPLAPILTREMGTFKAKVVLAGTEPGMDWRESADEDLVLAVGLAAWQGERDQPDAGEPLTFPDTRLPPMSHY